MDAARGIVWVACVTAATATLARAQPPAAIPRVGDEIERPVRDPEAIQPPVGDEWQIVEEAPEDVASDADFVSWGVVARHARHFTRASVSETQVCSIEVWVFSDARPAQAAAAEWTYPDWSIERSGEVLVMVHALTLSRAGSNRTVFQDCAALGGRALARADGDRAPPGR